MNYIYKRYMQVGMCMQYAGACACVCVQREMRESERESKRQIDRYMDCYICIYHMNDLVYA